MRTSTLKNVADVPAALQFAAGLTSYLNKSYSLNMKFGIELFSGARVHWHFESDSLDKMLQLNSKLLQDREYWGMVEKARGRWVEGAAKDSIVSFQD